MIRCIAVLVQQPIKMGSLLKHDEREVSGRKKDLARSISYEVFSLPLLRGG